MDLRMPGSDGIQATARIRGRWPDMPVLVLTTFDDDANLFVALRAGAAGYLLKDVSSETLVEAILADARGYSVVQCSVTCRSSLARQAGASADVVRCRRQTVRSAASGRGGVLVERRLIRDARRGHSGCRAWRVVPAEHGDGPGGRGVCQAHGDRRAEGRGAGH